MAKQFRRMTRATEGVKGRKGGGLIRWKSENVAQQTIIDAIAAIADQSH